MILLLLVIDDFVNVNVFICLIKLYLLSVGNVAMTMSTLAVLISIEHVPCFIK